MHKLIFNQQLPISITACWEFFSSPHNLALLTPPHLGFVSDPGSRQEMYPGQIIIHRIRPFVWGPAVTWVTEIAQVDRPHYFVDEQRIGPYRFWHHEHRFIEMAGGCQVIDLLHYQLPLGVVGRFINRCKVARDLQEIFGYRRAKLRDIFGEL